MKSHTFESHCFHALSNLKSIYVTNIFCAYIDFRTMWEQMKKSFVFEVLCRKFRALVYFVSKFMICEFYQKLKFYYSQLQKLNVILQT